MEDIVVTKDVAKIIKDVYKSNKKTMKQMRSAGFSEREIEESFEQGYNNALEYVMELLKIKEVKE